MDYQSLSNLIWNVCDDELRGLFKPHEYGSVILPFIVLRRLDCVLEPHKEKINNLYEKYNKELDNLSPIIKKEINLPFYNFSNYDLSRLKSDPQNVMTNFNNYLNGFSENVEDIIKNFDLRKYVEKLNDRNRLYQMVDKFTEIDLHPNKVSNHQMGTIYEELLRRFSEMSNEESGDHYTPRDVVTLLVSILFEGDKEELSGEGKIRSVYDCCCGTGGLLTEGKNTILSQINPKLKINLYGQELNPTTYSICKSDLLILGEDPSNIKGPKSSLSEDQFEGEKFDYMIVNPPFGESWSTEKEYIVNESKDPNGRFSIGLPWLKDGSFLFLQHLLKKMDDKSKIGIIFGGSCCFTGKPGSGESNNRKHLISNDMVECIIRLPKKLFFNTPLTTYIWIISNHKKPKRKGYIQLIDASEKCHRINRPLGKKFHVIGEKDRLFILEKYISSDQDEYSKFVQNDEFGFQQVESTSGDKKILTRIPLNINPQKYLNENKDKFPKNSVIDENKTQVGYEVIFNKYFYNYVRPNNLEVYTNKIKELDQSIDELKKGLIDV